MKVFKNLLWISTVLFCMASCSKEEVVEKNAEVPEGKVPVSTEIIVDGVVQTNTRASSEAGYTTGDGLYDEGDPVTVTAVANEGYELVSFYDKRNPGTNLGSSYTFPASIPQTFKAEFARKFTITVLASPTAGGTVSGGGKYKSGATCTLTATPNSGYAFAGWYEGSTKLSSSASYSFTVSSNRTITGKFDTEKLIMVGSGGNILTPSGVKKIGTRTWTDIIYGNGVYVAIGSDTQNGYISSSSDGLNWTSPIKIVNTSLKAICFGNGRFLVANAAGYAITSTDGTNWSTAQNMKMIPEGIAYGNGRFVACGSITTGIGGEGYATSTNGIDWITTTNTENWYDVAYGNNNFFIIGESSRLILTNEGIFESKRGVNSNTWNDLVYGDGKFVSVGNKGVIGRYVPSNPGLDRSVNVGTENWQTVIYYNNKFIACGGNQITYSSDGINWTTPELIKDISGNTISFRVYSVVQMP